MINLNIRFPGFLSILCVIFGTMNSYSQTTGKLAGKVLDDETGEPLVAANVVLEGTAMGASVDADGEFFVINILPGEYNVSVQMIGYETVLFENVRISVNRTYYLEARLKPGLLQGEEIVVTASAVSMKKDQTSSIRNISSNDMAYLPVENISGVVSYQPGVVVGHFRGGRLDEVSYLIDGLQVDDSFYNQDRTIDVETEVVEDLEIITGTFNAEYGRAMSGIVNAVTKDGENEFQGSVSANAANYLTSHTDVFMGLDKVDFNRNQDYQIYFTGPVLKNYLRFITNVRYQKNLNHLNGIRRFNVDDYSEFGSNDSSKWYTEHTGDNAYVPMNDNKDVTFFGKLTFMPSTSIKMSLMYNLNTSDWQNYNHHFKYNPDGLLTHHKNSEMFAVQLNQTVSNSAFYECKASYLENNYGSYVYENPLSADYVHDQYYRNEGPGFYTGGQQKSHVRRNTGDYNLKFDLVWQISQVHNVKTGLLIRQQYLDIKDVQIRNTYFGTEFETMTVYDSVNNHVVFPYYEPVVMPDSSVFSDIYQVEPREFACYIQDKMEFEEMVINMGVRLDYFDPNTVYPSQPRNPANQLSFPDDSKKMSQYPEAEPQWQISPRLGLSYQLGDKALLRFAYGHFFQMPPLYAIYQNHSFLVPPEDYAVTMGNPKIKAQKTIQYEIGLWQELVQGMNLEVAIFYRDIYDLLSAKIISTYNQIEYGLYSNKDYGNVRGFEVQYEMQYGHINAFVNYTLQYTRGNADNPTFTFTRAGDSKDPVNRLISMSWDQRHTFNMAAGYHTQTYGSTLTLMYNSGTPYTWRPIMESTLSRVNLFPNNDYKPSRLSVDLNAYYNLFQITDYKVRLKLLVYNLLDFLNDNRVNDQTGKSYTAIIRESEELNHRSDFNTYIDRVQDPSMFDPPRLVKLGLEVAFR